MKPQQRLAEPAVLRDHGQDWTDKWLARRKKAKANNRSIEPGWPVIPKRSAHYDPQRPNLNHHLLGPLSEMTQGHCAFCDCNWRLTRQSDETIEHFRPKSWDAFAHLVYTWVNLYFACSRCQGAKLERWDENKIALAPDDDYQFDHHFVANANGTLTPLTDAADTTVRLYKLNDSRLTRCREENMHEWEQVITQGGTPDIDGWPYRNFVMVPPMSPEAYRRNSRPTS